MIFALATLGIGLLIGLVVAIPRLQLKGAATFLSREKLWRLENELRKTVMQLVGGIAVLAGLLVTWQEFTLAQQSEFSDRFTKAIDQIGDNTEAVRLGGIFALESVARDSPVDTDAVTLVLAAFVRTHAKRSGAQQKAPLGSDSVAATRVLLGPTVSRSRSHRVDIRNVALPRLELASANIKNVTAYRSDLQRANFSSAELSNIDFSATDLSKSQFAGASLTGIRFVNAIMEKVSFRNASLGNADFQHAIMNNVDFRGADIQQANFRDARTQALDLRGAKYSKSQFTPNQLASAITK